MRVLGTLFTVISTTFALIVSHMHPTAWAFFDQTEASRSVTIAIGDFSFSDVQPWNPNTSYQIGDQFTFNGALWEVRALGDFSRPPEGDKLRPFGPYQEVTNEFRPFNTYFQGDIVVFNGIEYQALFDGMGGQTPGTVIGWQALTDEWQPFNVYFEGDIVTFNGIQYQALFDWVSIEPGTGSGWQALTDEWQPFNIYQAGDRVTFNGSTFEASWWNQGVPPEGDNVGQFQVWQLVETIIAPNATTHQFTSAILDANIIINGVTVVENGVIQQSGLNALNITMSKSAQGGSTYWEIRQGNRRMRIQNDGTITYTGPSNLSFDSLFISIPE